MVMQLEDVAVLLHAVFEKTAVSVTSTGERKRREWVIARTMWDALFESAGKRSCDGKHCSTYESLLVIAEQELKHKSMETLQKALVDRGCKTVSQRVEKTKKARRAEAHPPRRVAPVGRSCCSSEA